MTTIANNSALQNHPLRPAIVVGALGVVFGEGGIMALITC